MGKNRDEPSDDFFCVVTHEISMHKYEHKHKCILMQLKLQADNHNCMLTATITCIHTGTPILHTVPHLHTRSHTYKEKTHTCAFTYQRTNFGDSAIWVCKGVAPNGCVSVIWEWSHYWAFWDFSLPSLEMQEALIFNHPKVKKKGRSNICDHVSGVCGGVTPRGNVSVFSK